MILLCRQDANEPLVFIYDAIGGYEGNWASGPVECTGCYARWIAVRPSEHDDALECPYCKQMLGYARLGEGFQEVMVSLQ